MPSLTPSPSTETNASLPCTPPQSVVDLPQVADVDTPPAEPQIASPGSPSSLPIIETEHTPENGKGKEQQTTSDSQGYLHPPAPRPNFSRRPSYDLFECIEQSKHKRLSENHARYIFAQVVEAVYYLNGQGITHCDIKDENLVIDSEYKVRFPSPLLITL